MNFSNQSLRYESRFMICTEDTKRVELYFLNSLLSIIHLLYYYYYYFMTMTMNDSDDTESFTDNHFLWYNLSSFMIPYKNGRKINVFLEAYYLSHVIYRTPVGSGLKMIYTSREWYHHGIPSHHNYMKNMYDFKYIL